MNSVREIQRINEKELELGILGSGSWHDQYKDSAYIYVGGLPFDVTEGDVITIFSQYGEIVNIHLPRARDEAPKDNRRGRASAPPKPTNKHRGFGFLMYEDQRSTILAVDNLNGALVLGRTLRVDHVANYKPERVRDAEGNLVEPDEQTFNCAPPETVVDDDAEPDVEVDLDDPMAEYIAHTHYVRSRSTAGAGARIPIRAGATFGAVQSRGERAGQEDAMAAACISLPCEALREHIVALSPPGASRDPWFGWSCAEAGGAELGSQVVWFGVYDGHGGPRVSQLLHRRLHHVFESVEPDMVTDTVQYTRSLGGYFRRFTGGVLDRWVRKDLLVRAPRAQGTGGAPAGGGRAPPSPPQTLSELARSTQTPSGGASPSPAPQLTHYIACPDAAELREAPADATLTRRIPPPEDMRGKELSLEERAALTYLMMDREIQQNDAYVGQGSTASVVLLHSLDRPAAPWFSSEYISISAVHLGDTRFVLCSAADGRAMPLTAYHHPSEPNEAARLSRLGAGIVTDSFGEMRWMGTLANTRSFGDSAAKKYGVTAEPEVRSHFVRGRDFAFLVGFSDGISSVLSDQEIVDLCRGTAHPQDAAKRIIGCAEDLGTDDNATVLCIPLAGWGNVQGEDVTREAREKRRRSVDLYRDRRK
ncbi:hypothetical protein MSPP1_003742 [Malassezia sp. CBS 17886]|nr:hypothetical protein MSPP1_003742 [Malassezia sp. CBS 17886]